MKKLDGRVAIVTGASSGLGWQSAVRLAEEGVRLCVTARRGSALEELSRTVGGALVVPGDVTREEDVRRVVAECMAAHGRINLLVNVAAVQAYATFEEMPWDDLLRILDVTCLGYLRFAKAVLPHFRRQKEGHILNVLSMLSLGAAPLLSAYTMAKHALLGWSDSLRLELTGSGIDVSNVLVPSIATPMFDHAPTTLDRAPQPIPPTYDTDLVARAVVRCAKRPNARAVPVFLQGRLILGLQALAPSVGDFILGRWGRALQMRDETVHRREGNLYEPVPQGVGPRGSVPPTPAWMRWAATAALAGVGALGVLGAAKLARRAASALR